MEYGLLQKAVPNKRGKGGQKDHRPKALGRWDIAFWSIVADLCRMECYPYQAGLDWPASNAMHCIFRLSWVVERVGSWKGWLTTAESKFHLNSSKVN